MWSDDEGCRFRTPYNYDRKLASVHSGLACPPESLAKQEYKEECDINTIAENFGIGSSMPEGVVAPTFGDFTGVRDYKSALDAIAKSREAFDAMPAPIRERFRNDPHEFVNFCSDRSNYDEAVKLGLVVRPATPVAPPPSPVAPSPVPAAPAAT